MTRVAQMHRSAHSQQHVRARGRSLSCEGNVKGPRRERNPAVPAVPHWPALTYRWSRGNANRVANPRVLPAISERQRRGRDSNPRWTEPPIPVFETGTTNPHGPWNKGIRLWGNEKGNGKQSAGDTLVLEPVRERGPGPLFPQAEAHAPRS